MKKRYIMSIVTSLFLLVCTPNVNAKGIDLHSPSDLAIDGTVNPGSLNIKSKKSESLEGSNRKIDSTLNKLLKAKKDNNPQQINAIKKIIKSNKAYITPNEASARNINNATGDLVYVYVNIVEGYNGDSIKKYVAKLENYDSDYNLATAWVEVDNLEKLAAFNGVRNISMVNAPIVNTGSKESQGDIIEGVQQFRKLIGATGRGIKVGVISDGVDHLSSAKTTGDLGNVTVLRNSVGGDEGTAMLEIVHDLAPDAALYFADCGGDFIDFNKEVDALVNAGCNVIVDDIGWFKEPFFEDGIIASHLNYLVENRNIVYVTSAGNSQDSHYQGNFNSYPIQADDGTHYFHDFDKDSPGLQLLPIRIKAGYGTHLTLEWDDKFGEFHNDYDLYVYNNTGDLIVAYSWDYQNETLEPVEDLEFLNNSGSDQTYYIAIEKYSGDDKTLELYNYGGTLSSSYSTPEDSIYGHAAAENVITVGAIRASDPTQIEYFSSLGPCTIAYPSLVTRGKPDVCGIDGVSVTGAGGFPSTFYGTSASAPHIAAIAAVFWSQDTTKTAEDVKNKILSSTEDLGDTGFDTVYGHGLVNLTSLAIPAVPKNLTAVPDDKKITLSWTLNTETFFNGYQIDYRKVGAASWTSIPVGKTLASYTILSLTNGVEYEFRIKAKNTVGDFSSYSDIIKSIPADKTAPLVPTNFKAATVTDQKVVLTWTAPTATDLAGYHLCYLTEDNPEAIITVDLGKVLTYTLNGLTNDKNYIIKLYALDSSANQSVPANLTAMPVDNVAPAVPTGLKAASSLTKDYTIDVSWTGNTESDLDSYVLLYQKSGTLVQQTASIAAGNTSTQIENLDPKATYSFKIKAVDKKGNASALSTAVSAVTKDVTPPAAPLDFKAVSGDRNVTLSWTANAEKDLNGYQLDYRKEGSTTWISVSIVNTSTSYLVSSLTNGSNYEFKIKAKDTTINWSAYTNTVTAVPRDNVAPLAPTNFKAATVTDQKLVLNWTPPTAADLAGYHLSYSTEDNPEAVTTVDLGKVLTYTLNGLTNDKNYIIKLYALDTSSNESNPANLSAMPVDNVAPAVPKGLKAVPGNKDYSINVSWTANTESDLNGYVIVYQKSGSTLQDTVSVAADALSTQIENLSPNAAYSFKLKAVDKKGNASALSLAVSATTKDVTPPAAPAGLNAEVADRKTALAWTGNTETDLNGYQLEYRKSGVLTWTSVAVLKTSTNYTVSSLINGTTYEFRLKAKDTTGNWSNYSDTITAIPKDNIAPAAPTNFKASTLTDQKIVLTWSASTATDISGYRIIYGAPGSLDPPTIIDIGKVLTYTLTGLTNGQNYNITIYAIDTSANLSQPANITAASVDNVAPAVPKGLQAALTSQNYTINLTWTANTEPDLQKYVVAYQKSGSSEVQTIDYPQGFNDVAIGNLTPNATYYFKVKAVDVNGNASSYSTAVSCISKDVTPPSVPKNLSALAGNKNVVLSWALNEDIDLNGYQLEYRAVNTTTWKTVTLGKTVTTYTVNYLTNGITYEFRLKAKDVTGNWSLYTDAITCTPGIS